MKGLLRALATALKEAIKVPIVKVRRMCCSVSYALEGMLRREIDSAGGVLHGVQHGEQVEFDFSLAEATAEALVAQLNEAGQGRIIWS